MYYCQDCKKEFEFVEVVFQRHGLDNPPFERLKLCPFCHSDNFKELTGTHCRYCGSKLSIKGDYCSIYCRKIGEKLWEKETNEKFERKKSLLQLTLQEIDSYNKSHKTRLSYGQYIELKKENLNG